MNFTRAIVRKPGRSFVNGLTTSDLGKPDYEMALMQHQHYITALQQCGVEVTVLEADEQFPDSTFVEDTAVLTDKCAIVTNPGADSRNGEKHSIREALKRFYGTIEEMKGPGTLDGGDVLQVENHFYIGLSARTNSLGAQEFQTILSKYGYTSTQVPLKHFFHLKTGIAYLGGNDLVVAGEFIGNPLYEGFHEIAVKRDEYAANCIRMNDFVILPKGFDETKHNIAAAGYSVIEVDMSEFRKQDGGLSCLSLRF